MRLTENQRQTIKSAVTRVIGEGTRLWLFGSRVDDSKRGGDILGTRTKLFRTHETGYGLKLHSLSTNQWRGG